MAGRPYPQLQRAKQIIEESFGLAMIGLRDADLWQTLQAHASHIGLSEAQLITAIEQRLEPIITPLLEQLTVGESFFFREQQHWQVICNELMPRLRREQGQRRLRCWSAGCADGEEPYSLAMLAISHRESLGELEIIGSDLNPSAIERAQRGQFREWAFRGVDQQIRDYYFRYSGGRWAIIEAVREQVRWSIVNLALPWVGPPQHGPQHCDLIICRNVLIYFSQDRAAEVQARLEASLAPGGWLILGPADPQRHHFSACERYQFGSMIAYRRREQASIAVGAPQRRSGLVRPPGTVIVASNAGLCPIWQARAALNSGEWQQARKICEAILRGDQFQRSAYHILGLTYAEEGDSQRAMLAQQHALQLDPTFIAARLHLAHQLQRHGDQSSAQAHFAQIMNDLQYYRQDEKLPGLGDSTVSDLRDLLSFYQE